MQQRNTNLKLIIIKQSKTSKQTHTHTPHTHCMENVIQNLQYIGNDYLVWTKGLYVPLYLLQYCAISVAF